LTSLDFRTNINLDRFDCSNNNLTHLFLKNGGIFWNISFDNNPTLKYICCDDIQLAQVNQSLISNPIPNIEVNTYCSFTPGGSYNTIKGNYIFDENNNGCDANDLKIIPNLRTNITDNNLNTGATFTDSAGTYTFYTGSGTFLLDPAIENLPLFNFTPLQANVTFIDTNNNVSIRDFCITSNGINPDVEVVITPKDTVVQGSNTTFKMVYKNKGNQTVSGSIQLNFNDAILNYVSATNIPTSITTDTLSWAYTTLLPFESRSFEITFYLNSSLEIPPVLPGDTLKFKATITPAFLDETPSDNVFSLNQIVGNSYNPNQIICLQGDVVSSSEIGEHLHYFIQFQNTGIGNAVNVVVKKTINPTSYDLSSIQLLNSSHPVYTRMKGNVIEFIFENVQLEDHKHGNILLKMKSRDTLIIGDSVTQTVEIFFDYNTPIVTDMAATTFARLVDGIKTIDNTIEVYPNPTSGLFTIRTENSIKNIEIFDTEGRLLFMKIGNFGTQKIDISDRVAGVYFVKTTTDKGVQINKIIKQ